MLLKNLGKKKSSPIDSRESLVISNKLFENSNETLVRRALCNSTGEFCINSEENSNLEFLSRLQQRHQQNYEIALPERASLKRAKIFNAHN